MEVTFSFSPFLLQSQSCVVAVVAEAAKNERTHLSEQRIRKRSTCELDSVGESQTGTGWR